jgi:hypothetical protein
MDDANPGHRALRSARATMLRKQVRIHPQAFVTGSAAAE